MHIPWIGQHTGNMRVLFTIAVLHSIIALVEVPPALSAVSRQVESDGMTLMKIGNTAFQQGRFNDAVKAFESASSLFTSVFQADVWVEAECHRARAYMALGQYAKALTLLENAQHQLRATSNTVNALLLGTLGKAYYLTGSLQLARHALQSGIELAKRDDKDALLASFFNTLGMVHAVGNKVEAALDAFSAADKAARRAGLLQLAVRSQINASQVCIQQKSTDRIEQAAGLLQTASNDLLSLDDSYNKAFSLISLGRQYTRIGTTFNDSEVDPSRTNAFRKTALEAYVEAEKIGKQLDLPMIRSYAIGYRGGLYEDVGRYEEAQALTRQAIFLAQEAHSPESLYLWQWQNGRLLTRIGTNDEAISVYRRAIYTLETIRADLSVVCNQGNRLSFRDTVGPLYFELADLLLRRSASQRDVHKRQEDLVAARDTVEQLKAVELQDYFQDECVTALQSKATGLEQIADKTAAIYPILLPDRTELLVTLPNGLKQFTVDAGSSRVTREVRRLRVKLQRPDSRYIRHVKKLYKWLIQPIEKELETQGVETLIIVPDGPLRTIPLSVLNDGRKFLVEKFSLVTTPGLTLTDPQPIRRESLQLLVGGLTEAVQGFSALPNVDYELKQLQQMYTCELLRNEKFSIGNMARSLQGTPFPIVHIASHGQFDRDPEKTFLLTYNEKLSMTHLQDLMGLGQYRDVPVELLTLSACQTAAGDDRAALGLAGVALKSGARSAVATLWFINDEATSQLISIFYKQLQDPALSKAQALQKAQLQLMAQEQFKHPAFWAPFLLIGNWL